ncbi:MAG: LPS assembly protein LptD [Pseudomonadota bacterium]
MTGANRSTGPRLLRAAIAALALLVSQHAVAQERAEPQDQVALIADQIAYDETTGVVTAEGMAQIFYKGRTLTTDAIVYDSVNDRVAATGSVVLRTEDGETVYADMAELDADLREGLVEGARSVIAGNGKIAAVEAQRIDGRYNVLEKAVFSPCEVCANRPVPLWRIRAERILHDQEAGEIHYEDAYFDVLGVPIGFLPYFRHPSPEVDRATGFLEPELSRDRGYGIGVKLPYYIVLDDHSDLTLTPFLATGDGVLLEGQYRRQFVKGYVDLELYGGVANYGDDGRGARPRIGGFGEGRFQVGEGAFAGFDYAFAADDPFLRRYDYTERDRLTTEGFLRFYDGASFASGSVAFMQSLRAGEPQGAIPVALPEISLRHVMDAPLIGGEFGVSVDALGLIREDGRDVGRASLGADWSRQVVTQTGVVLRGFADVTADFYRIGDDPAFDNGAARFLPRVGAEARMPLLRADGDGGTHVIEPIAQFVLAPDVFQGDIPNEDAILVEFDEMNLFETDRFVGGDRVETGAYANLGFRYEYFSDDLTLRASAGRILRLEDDRVFSLSSGLNSDASDYVTAASLGFMDWFDIYSRFRFSDDFGLNRAEVGARVDRDRFSVFSDYLFLDADPTEASFIDRSEIRVGGSLALTRNWTLGGEARRDLIADSFVNASGVLTYEDECAGLDLFVQRQFTESASAPRGTSVGFRVRLFGAGSGDQSKASGACAYGL